MPDRPATPSPRQATATLARDLDWGLTGVRADPSTRVDTVTWQYGPHTVTARWVGETLQDAVYTGPGGGEEASTVSRVHGWLMRHGGEKAPVPVIIAGIRAGEVQQQDDGTYSLRPLLAPAPALTGRTELDAARRLIALLDSPDPGMVEIAEFALANPDPDAYGTPLPGVAEAVKHARAVLTFEAAFHTAVHGDTPGVGR